MNAPGLVASPGALQAVLQALPRNDRGLIPNSVVARVYALIGVPGVQSKIRFADSNVEFKDGTTQWTVIVAYDDRIVRVRATRPGDGWFGIGPNAFGGQRPDESDVEADAVCLPLAGISSITASGHPGGWTTTYQTLSNDPQWTLHWANGATIDLPAGPKTMREEAWRPLEFVLSLFER